MSGFTLPTVMTVAGLQPQTPASLNAQIIAQAETLAPGLTATLPGSLIEDISSTETGAVVVIDQARVDLVNSLTPYGANAFILNQLGQVYGVRIGKDTNTSVFVVFTGTVGFVVAKSFVVSDGTNQYVVQDGGVIATGGSSQPLSAVANTTGTWAVPASTVTQLITSVPSGVTLSVTNPLPGTPSPGAQTEEDYRAQVLQAGLVTSVGTQAYLKTLLGNVVGTQQRLISARQVVPPLWEIICGGSGDPYEIAYAIWYAMDDINILTGSVLGVAGITNANPGVVTTTLNHGYVTGQVITVTGVVGMSGINGTPLTITVIDEKTFSIGIDTTGSGTYTSGGVITPNFRNVSANLYDYPDTYTVTFVAPPLQTVTMTVTWNTIATNYVSAGAVAAAAQPALQDYVNSLAVGQPMNLFELQATFQVAIVAQVPTQLLTRMVFAVYINGILTVPETGTGIIAGDPESYFSTTAVSITVNQG
jgi:hypothetical protein